MKNTKKRNAKDKWPSSILLDNKLIKMIEEIAEAVVNGEQDRSSTIRYAIHVCHDVKVKNKS